ncbi:MAG: molybdopterin-synthase adenylyltransferase MoeB [candidate division Zixibacteria bacterium]|nr:molybdopterin-synthase adenylyltransferase MoeB [candidate division Zixibacteria bacterium]
MSQKLSSQELLTRIKREIREMPMGEIRAKLDRGDDFTLIDVREQDEYDQGFIDGAVHIPRGFLELRVENLTGDRDREIVLYCAGGNRSALAAKSLEAMGYANVISMKEGFNGWRNGGYPVAKTRNLTPAERERYSRHLIVPEIGEKGQVKILESRVLLVGTGGLGSPAAYYLAAAGVGTIGLVDFDTVDVTNLQRQIIHGTSDIGRPKVLSAKETINELNPDVRVVLHETRLMSDNILDILKDYDIVVDGCDNFPTRYLINDACVLAGKPNVHGSIYQFDGYATVFHPGKGPCYRCLYPEPPPPGAVPSCDEAGVLGVLPGTVGLIQATETLKMILGKGESLIGRILMYDALEMSFQTFNVQKDPSCPICGENPTVRELIDYEAFCGLHAAGG